MKRPNFNGNPTDLSHFLELATSPPRSEQRERALRRWEEYKLAREVEDVRSRGGLFARPLLLADNNRVVDLRGAWLDGICVGRVDLRGVLLDGASLRGAWLTGAKNSVKGAGFFWGAMWLKVTSYIPALIVQIVMIIICVPPAWFWLDRDLAVSKSKKRLTLREIFDKGRDVNILSLARMFLFGSRDLWFEVPLPVFLRGTVDW